MPRKSDTKAIANKSLDRRVKLTDEDREAIKELKGKMTQTAVASMYNINRRTVSFIWYPEKLKENLERRKERGGSRQYYDREKHNASMREHRDYKKKLAEKGLI